MKKTFYFLLIILCLACFNIEICAKEQRKGVPLRSFNENECLKSNFNFSGNELTKLQEENFMLRKQKEALESEKIKLLGIKVRLEKEIQELKKCNEKLKEKNDELYIDHFLFNSDKELESRGNRKFKNLTALNNIKQLCKEKENVPEKIRLRVVQLIKNDKKNEGYYFYNLALAYEEQKNFRKAIENYRLAIEADSKYIPAYENLGLIYTEIGNYENAIDIFEKFIKVTEDPEERRIIKEFTEKIKILVDKQLSVRQYKNY